MRKTWGIVISLAVIVPAFLCFQGCDDNGDDVLGMVYAMTNATTGNEVVAYRRASDGTLTFLNSYPTGGNGSQTTAIDPLVSQGSLVFSSNGRFLFAVNAGSNTISSFRVANDGVLTQADIEPSGGIFPNSISEFSNLLYVSNAGNETTASNVTGFRVEIDGSLTQIAGSTHTLSAADAHPSCVLFNSNGTQLEVSESSTNLIDIFGINMDGTLTGPTFNNSSGAGPFGSVFLTNGTLLVTEAGAGAVSSYSVASDGTTTAISPSVANGQTATCWISATPNQNFAFTSNTGSSTISSYNIGIGGELTLGQNIASTLEGPNSFPVDTGVSRDGQFFYVLEDGPGAITTLRIGTDGSLTRIQAVSGQLPTTGAQGLAVR